jgi:hypothetical protein
MNPVVVQSLLSLLRLALGAAGVELLDDGQLEKVVGAILFLGSFAWSVYNHRKADEAKKQAAFEKVLAFAPVNPRKPVGKASH